MSVPGAVLSPAALIERPRRRSALPTVVTLVGPFSLSLVLCLTLAGRPSYWEDETFTLSAARRPVSSLPHLLRDVDAVHGLYYATLSPLAHVTTAAAWTRLPSALATALAAGLVALLGCQLIDRRTGWVAGTVFAVLPITSYYGAEARGYALASACVVASTVSLVRATRSDGRRNWVLYGGLMLLGGYAFLFTALFAVAHVTWLLAHRSRANVSRFLVATVGVAVGLAPLIAVGARQSAFQISWIDTPNQTALAHVWTIWTSGSVVLAAVVWALVAVTLGTAARSTGRPIRPAVALMSSVALAPVAVLITASFIHPVYAPRYVEASVAGLALLCGTALARIRRTPVLVVVVLLVGLVGLPAQITQRQVDGHGDTQSVLAEYLTAHQEPGDAVLFSPTYWRVSSSAYPHTFTELVDLTCSEDPAVHGDYIGGVVTSAELTRRLADGHRIWWWHHHGEPATGSDAARQLAVVRAAGFQVAERHAGRATDLDLLVRQ